MLTPFGPGGISSVNRPKTYYPVSRKGAPQTASPERKFDTFSSEAAGKSGSFQMRLVGRLSQEVRATTTTGDIQELRRSVAAGEYHPDPMSIARSILFMTDD